MDDLNKNQITFILSLLKLRKQGIHNVMPDQHAKVLFPSGFTISKYNEIIPKLVSEQLLTTEYGAPRDGPVISLTTKAVEQFG